MSEFASPGTLGDYSDRLESIWKQAYSLAEFEDPKNFKTYEQLQQRLNLVLGKAPAAPRIDRETQEDEAVFDTPVGGFNDLISLPVNLGVKKYLTPREGSCFLLWKMKRTQCLISLNLLRRTDD